MLPPIRGAQFLGILDGTTPPPAKTIKAEKGDKTEEVPNPAYATWLAQDQQVLAFLVNSLSSTILAQVATLTTSSEVWAALENMYSAQSRARVTNLRMQLASLKKGSMNVAAYFDKMKTLGDEIAAAGKPIDNDEMVSFILNGLDFEYNPIVSSILGRTDPISINDLYAQIMAFEMLLEMFDQGSGNKYQSSANSASRGRGRGSFIHGVVATTATVGALEAAGFKEEAMEISRETGIHKVEINPIVPLARFVEEQTTRP